MSEEGATVDEVAQVLWKALPNGQLTRIPRHPDHRDIVLGVLCLGMQRRYPYSEEELNEWLAHQLSILSAQVDHVTCRRYLVDLGFVKRDRAGLRYILNTPRLKRTLSAAVQADAADLVRRTLDEKAAVQMARRRARDERGL